MKATRHYQWQLVRALMLAAMVLFVGACGATGSNAPAGIQNGVDLEDLENPASVGPEEVFGELQKVNPPLAASDTKLVGSEDMTYEEFVQAVGADSNALWRALFENSGYSYSNAEILLYEQPISSTGCVEVADPELGPFYCPVNQVVHYPLTWTDPSSGENPSEIGDFAVALIVAHEIGHHVENLLGEFNDPNIFTIQLELRADCLAGIWARSVYEQGLLEAGDIGEAVQLTANAADLPGTDPMDPGAHGTERQRTDAFFTGYETGDTSQCAF